MVQSTLAAGCTRAVQRRVDPARDADLRHKVKAAPTRAEAIEASKEVWDLGRSHDRVKWEYKFRKRAEGTWGWKIEFRKFRKQPIQGIKTSPNANLIVKPEEYKDIVNDYNQKIFDDTDENVEEFLNLMKFTRASLSTSTKPSFTMKMLITSISKMPSNKGAGKDWNS